MSTDHRRQACTGSDGPTPRRALPLDLLLEFAARADAATLVRFAATSKSLRRGILGPDFRRRLLAVRAAAGRWWFDPALLRGVSYYVFMDEVTDGVYDYHTDVNVIATPHSSPPRIIIDRDLLFELKPVASRDGFLVLRFRMSEDAEEDTCRDLCVCDTCTGHVTRLPPIGLSPRKNWHTPALLTVDDDDGAAGRSFELLVADNGMTEFQTFSSKAGQWSAVRAATFEGKPPYVISHRSHPAVLGRTVHWFCICMGPRAQIMVLDVDTGRATMQQLPLRDMVGSTSGKEYFVAAVGGRLSLIVVGSLEVSMFMLTTASASEPTWSRQLVIRTPEIDRWSGLDVDSISAVLPVRGFGERSGTLVMQLKNGDLVRLELGTKEATTLCKGMERISEVFLHEIDLQSLLQAMKSY